MGVDKVLITGDSSAYNPKNNLRINKWAKSRSLLSGFFIYGILVDQFSGISGMGVGSTTLARASPKGTAELRACSITSSIVSA